MWRTAYKGNAGGPYPKQAPWKGYQKVFLNVIKTLQISEKLLLTCMAREKKSKHWYSDHVTVWTAGESRFDFRLRNKLSTLERWGSSEANSAWRITCAVGPIPDPQFGKVTVRIEARTAWHWCEVSRLAGRHLSVNTNVSLRHGFSNCGSHLHKMSRVGEECRRILNI
jgi:hypothetical protein